MNRRLLVLFLLVFAIATPPRLAFACQCSPESASAALSRAKLIIEGTVASQRPSTTGSSQTIVELEAVRTLRGEPLGPTLAVKNGFECAPQTVEPGRRYVVYLSSKDDVMTACSRLVQVTALAPEEVAAFGSPPRPAGDPVAPSASTSEPNAPPPIEVGPSTQPATERPAGGAGCASCTVGSDKAPAPAAGALVAIALLGARRRRR